MSEQSEVSVTSTLKIFISKARDPTWEVYSADGHSNLNDFDCVCVYIPVRVYACVGMHMYMCACGGQRPGLGIFFNCSLHYF